MVPTKPIHEQRRLLRERPGCRFVESEEFYRLLLGFKKLIRADETALKIRGLLDEESGTRIFIEQEKLLPPQPHHTDRRLSGDSRRPPSPLQCARPAN
jgi:hypothetical protein